MKRLMLLAVAAVVAMAGAAGATEFEIKMLNKGVKGNFVFEPDFVRAEVGDTLKFIAVDKGHSAETIGGMLPEGAAGFKGKTNEEIVYTIDQEGVYGIKCAMHYSGGHVMLVVAGEPVNAEAAQAVRHPSKPRAHFEELFEQLKQ